MLIGLNKTIRMLFRLPLWRKELNSFNIWFMESLLLKLKRDTTKFWRNFKIITINTRPSSNLWSALWLSWPRNLITKTLWKFSNFWITSEPLLSRRRNSPEKLKRRLRLTGRSCWPIWNSRKSLWPIKNKDSRLWSQTPKLFWNSWPNPWKTIRSNSKIWRKAWPHRPLGAMNSLLSIWFRPLKEKENLKSSRSYRNIYKRNSLKLVNTLPPDDDERIK